MQKSLNLGVEICSVENLIFTSKDIEISFVRIFFTSKKLTGVSNFNFFARDDDRIILGGKLKG